MEEIKIRQEHETILRIVSELGLVTVNIAQALRPKSDYPGWSPATIRNAIRKLREMDLLSEYPVALSKTGRPEKVYLLNEVGEQVCKQLGIKVPPNIRDDIALAHRLCQAQIAARARAANFEALVEKVLAFDRENGNFRADVLVRGLETGDQIIEVEQGITRSHLPRAVEKFTGLAEIFNTRSDLHLSRQVLMVFNLRDKELDKTLKVWSDALGQVFPDLIVPFDLRYCTMREFMATLSFQDVSVYALLEGTVKPERKPARSNTNLFKPSPESLQFSPSDMSPFEHAEYLQGIVAGDQPFVDEDARDRFRGLAKLAKFIYEPCFGPGKPTTISAAIPYDSIKRLREYLFMPENEKFLRELQDGVAWLRKPQTGLTLYRMAVMELMWNVFMYHFGLDKDGPLHIAVQVPGIDPGVYETKLALSISPAELQDAEIAALHPGSADDRKESEDAISWVLTAIATRPVQLGLALPLWSRKKTKRSIV